MLSSVRPLDAASTLPIQPSLLQQYCLLVLPEDVLVHVLRHLDGADLGRISQTCRRIRQVLAQRVEPWHAALIRLDRETHLPSAPATARLTYLLLYCRRCQTPRCPGCGRPATPPQENIVGAGASNADFSTLPLCILFSPTRVSTSANVLYNRCAS